MGLRNGGPQSGRVGDTAKQVLPDDPYPNSSALSQLSFGEL